MQNSGPFGQPSMQKQFKNLETCIYHLVVDGINSLRLLSDAYTGQQTKPTMVVIMTGRLIGNKPLFNPVMDLCQLER